MQLRINSEKKRTKSVEVKEIGAHAHVDTKPKHALNQSVLIPLPIEKIVEKRSQKGENDLIHTLVSLSSLNICLRLQMNGNELGRVVQSLS